MKTVLAFDFGASNGRALLGKINEGKIVYEEVHRFPNDPVFVNGSLYWDILRLFYEIKTAIVKANQMGGFDSIGIDTWGVDFCFIDKKGNLVNNPYHYRDARNAVAMEKTFELIPKEILYGRTGIQFMNCNTLFQLYAAVNFDKEVIERADKMLFIPDFFAYLLTGAKVAEMTIASTSQMLNAETRDWDYELLEKIGVRRELLPEIVKSGHTYGNLKADICEELGCKSVPVIAVCCHDTGSAVASVPSLNMDNCCYLSSGTWSLMGVELDKPIINEKSFEKNFTNEGGYNGTIRFLKNIMGLWIIQECKRAWEKEGKRLSFGEIADLANEAESVCYIDPDYDEFMTPLNMPEKIKKFCQLTNQKEPKSIGETARAVYESLALKYKKTLLDIEELTNKKFTELNVIGGGSKADILCRFTADICGITVKAGPQEATALGNMAVQFIALGEINDINSARKIILDSEDIKVYTPSNSNKADFNEFLSICKKYKKA